MAHAHNAQASSWAFRSYLHPSKMQKNRRVARQPVVTQAEKSGLQRLLQPFEGFSKEEEVSFRWDPANLRWAKSKGKLADDAEMMITPLIGEPYMVSDPGALQKFRDHWLCKVFLASMQPAMHHAGVACST